VVQTWDVVIHCDAIVGEQEQQRASGTDEARRSEVFFLYRTSKLLVKVTKPYTVQSMGTGLFSFARVWCGQRKWANRKSETEQQCAKNDPGNSAIGSARRSSPEGLVFRDASLVSHLPDALQTLPMMSPCRSRVCCEMHSVLSPQVFGHCLRKKRQEVGKSKTVRLSEVFDLVVTLHIS